MTDRKHCCKDMDDAVELSVAGDPFSNPDVLIHYELKFDEYGLIIHDGGTSSIEIQYCPWCGGALPKSRSSEWFELLEGMGLDPWEDKLPPEFESDEWYRKRTQDQG